MGTVRDEELGDMAYVMSDPRGRRFVYRLLGVYGLFRSVATYFADSVGGPKRVLNSPEWILYKAAQQEVAQGLQSEALACDKIGKLYLTMLSEAEAKRKEREIEEEKKLVERKQKKESHDGGSSGNA